MSIYEVSPWLEKAILLDSRIMGVQNGYLCGGLTFSFLRKKQKRDTFWVPRPHQG